jgi:hypothetical protein
MKLLVRGQFQFAVVSLARVDAAGQLSVPTSSKSRPTLVGMRA